MTATASAPSFLGPLSTRHVLAALLLLVEVACLRGAFTIDGLAGRPETWARAYGQAGHNVPLVLGALLGGALVLGPAGLRRMAAGLAQAPPRRRAALGLGLHVAAVAALTWTTWVLFEVAPVGWRGWALAALWPALGALTLGSLLAAVSPPGALRELVSSAGLRLGAGAVLGIACVALGARLADGWIAAEPLTRATVRLAFAIVQLVLPGARLEPEDAVLGTDAFLVHVTPFCSGYQGMALFLVFFAVFLGLVRDRVRFPRVLWLLPLGAAVAWCLNAVRIAALVVIGATGRPEVAMGGFHTHAGWPLLCATALGAAALAVRTRTFARATPGRDAGGFENPAVPWLLPIVAAMGAALLAGSFVAEPRAATPLGTVVGAVLVWRHRRAYGFVRPAIDPQAVGLGVLGALAWWATDRLHGGGAVPDDPFAWHAGVPAAALALWWAVRLAGAFVVAPLVEELAFRGYLLRFLVDRRFERVPHGTFSALSLLASSAAFAALHANMTGGLVCAVLYALALRRHGRVQDAVVAHATTNVLVWAFAAATGTWSLVV